MILISLPTSERKMGTYCWSIFKIIICSWSWNIIFLVFECSFWSSNFWTNIFIALQWITTWTWLVIFFSMMFIFSSHSKSLITFSKWILINIIISGTRNIWVFIISFEFRRNCKFRGRYFRCQLIFSWTRDISIFNTISIRSSYFPTYCRCTYLIRDIIFSRAWYYCWSFIGICTLRSFC